MGIVWWWNSHVGLRPCLCSTIQLYDLSWLKSTDTQCCVWCKLLHYFLLLAEKNLAIMNRLFACRMCAASKKHREVIFLQTKLSGEFWHRWLEYGAILLEIPLVSFRPMKTVFFRNMSWGGFSARRSLMFHARKFSENTDCDGLHFDVF